MPATISLIGIFTILLTAASIHSAPTCPAGVGTTSSGFQQTFISYAQFAENSEYRFRSPFNQIALSNITSLYVSLWVKQATSDSVVGTFLKCSESDGSDTSFIDFGIYKDEGQSESLGLKVMNFSYGINDIKTLPERGRPISLAAWNQYSFFVNTTKFLIGVNSEIQAANEFKIAKLPQQLIAATSHSNHSGVHFCEMGTNGFVGFFKNFLISFNISTFEQNLQQYAHGIPTPLDKQILAYYSFATNLDSQYSIETNRLQEAINIVFITSNEIDLVCQCNGQYSAFIELTEGSGFKEIPQIPNIPSNIASLQLNLTLFIKSVSSLQPSILVQHSNFWTLGIVNKTILQLSIQGQTINFSMASQKLSDRSVFIQYWMNYLIDVNLTHAALTINDFTQPSISQIVAFPQSLVLNGISPSGFNIAPANVDAYLYQVMYKVNQVQALSFTFTLDQFTQVAQTQLQTMYGTIKNNNAPLNGYFISPQGLNFSIQGVQFFQMKGPCNQSDPQFKFDGVVCGGGQKHLAFNQDSSKGYNLVESYTAPPTGPVTFETWFKFQGTFPVQGQTQATLMTNYQFLTIQMVHIYLSQGSGQTFNIVCNPYVSQTSVGDLYNPVTIASLVASNIWMHFSCVSDNNENQLMSYLFDPRSASAREAQQLNSHIISLPDTVPIRTILGNTKEQDHPFQGLMREVRFWSEARSTIQLSIYRYQSLPLTEVRSALTAYAMLNQGYGNKLLELSYSASTTPIFTTFSAQQSPLQWLTDTDLAICAPDTIYDIVSRCCVREDFNVTISSTRVVDANGNYIDILNGQVIEKYTTQVDNSTYELLWSIDSVSAYTSDLNDYNSHVNDIQSMINNQGASTLQLRVYQMHLRTDASYSFKLTARSKLRNYDQSRYQVYIVDPLCPKIQIVPTPTNGKTIRVSQYMDPSLLALSLNIQQNCSTPTTVVSYKWSLNKTQGNRSYLETTYDPVATLASLNSLDSINVTAKLYYTKQNQTTKLSVSDYLIIIPVAQPLQLNINQIPSRLYQGTDLEIEPSGSKFNTNYPVKANPAFSVQCPLYIFNSQADYDQLCKADPQTGVFRLPASSVNFVNNALYTFNYTLSSDIYNYSDTKTIRVQYYKAWYFNCPGVRLDPYLFFSRNQDFYVIRPEIKLDCKSSITDMDYSEIRYQIQDIQWQVTDFPNPNSFLDFHANGTYATVKEDVKAQLAPGKLINITVLVTINNLTYTSNTTITIQESKINIMVNTTLQETSINFEDVLIIDPTDTYDPDDPNATLAILWDCPDEITSDQCNYAQSKGVLNMSPIQRLSQGLFPGQTYTFTVRAVNQGFNSKSNSQEFEVSINKYGTSHTPACPITLTTSPSEVRVNIINSKDTIIKGQVDTSLCHLDIINGQVYFFGPSTLSQYGVDWYEWDKNITLQKEFLGQLELGVEYQVDMVYLFSYQQNGWIKYDYAVYSVLIQRLGAPLVAIINENSTNQTIGQEAALTLDATGSYDPDNSLANRFQYQWTCPANFTSCPSQGSKLVLTKDFREQNNINTLGATFQIGLRIYSPSKQSDDLIITVTVMKQDYSNCLVVGILNNFINKVIIMRDSLFPVQIKLYFQQQCAQIEVQQINWVSPQVPYAKRFWDIDSTGEIMIISNATKLPKNLSTVDMEVSLAYTIIGSNDVGNEYTAFNFTISFEGALIVSNIQTNLLSDQVYVVDSQSLVLDASASYDPDSILQSANALQCQWICSDHVKHMQYCSNNCKLELPVGSIALANSQSAYEVAFFSVNLTSPSGKSHIETVYITIIANSISQVLPQCMIVGENQDFNLADFNIFYPVCQFPASSSKYNLGNLQYQWELSPSINGVALDQRKLTIPPFYVLEEMSDKSATSLFVTLNVITSTVNGTVSYQIKSEYCLPVMNDAPGSTKITVSPPFGLTLFTDFTFTLQNSVLQNGQFYRLRVEKKDSTSEAVIAKSFNTSYTLNLPSLTRQLYIDIVQGMRQNGNDYTIYSAKANFMVDDISALSYSNFNNYVKPKLLSPVSANLKDIGTLQQEVQNLLGLANILDGLSSLDPTTFSQQLFSKLNTVILALEELEEVYTQVDILMVEQKLLAACVYNVRGLRNDQTSQDRVAKIIFEEFINSDKIQMVMVINENIQIKQNWISNMQQLLGYKLLNDDHTRQLASFIQQCQQWTMIEGDVQLFQNFTASSQTLIYQMRAIDYQLNSNITFDSPVANDNSKIIVQPTKLPSQVTYIAAKFEWNDMPSIELANSSSNETVLISTGVTEMSLQRRDLTLIEMSAQPGFKVDFYFQIQPFAQQQLNLTRLPFLCVYQQSDNQWSSQGLTTILVDKEQAIVRCQSTHLSTFALKYLQPSFVFEQLERDQPLYIPTIFEQLPILKILVPTIYLSFMILLVLIGATMYCYDLKSPRRLYNKLSIHDNIAKYSYTRLVGCLILQFNPLFNYCVKSNPYLSRPIRLIMFSNYLLMISIICGVVFLSLDNNQLIGEVSLISVFIWTTIVLFRAALHKWLFWFFYPSNFSHWQYMVSHPSPPEDSPDASVRFQPVNDLSESIRNDFSASRLIASPSNKDKSIVTEVQGDEIVKFRQDAVSKKSKKRLKEPTSNLSRISQHQDQDLQLSSRLSRSSNIEMMDLKASKPAEEQEEFNIIPGLPLGESQSPLKMSQLLANTQNDYQQEGGEPEEEVKDEQSEENLPSKDRKKKHKKRKHKKSRKDQDFSNIMDWDQQEQQTDSNNSSLENLPSQYRLFQVQPVSSLKKALGSVILISVNIGLMVAHCLILPQMRDMQFNNWFSSAFFASLIQLFGVDTLLYMIVAWALKKSAGKAQHRKFFSLFNFFVLWPLGKWKYIELEIELSKLKDFDKEYDVLILN